MKLRKTSLAIAAAALVAAPVAAQVVSPRASAPIANENLLFGDGEIAPGIIIAAIAGIAIGVLLLVDDDDDEPVSA